MADMLIPRTEGSNFEEANPSFTGKAFDGVLNDANATGSWYAYRGGTFVNSGYVGKDYGAGNEKVLVRARILVVADNETFNPRNATIEGSNDGTTFTTLVSLTDMDRTGTRFTWLDFSFTNTVAYRYLRVNVSQNWGNTGFCIITEIEFYEFVDATIITAFWNLPYYLGLPELQSFINERYRTYLGSVLNENYGNSVIVRNVLNEYYRDQAELRRVWNLLYGVSRGLISITDLPYNIQISLQRVLEENYSITESPIQNVLQALYDIRNTNPLSTSIDERYAISGNTLIETQDLLVEIDGVRVFPTLVNYEFNIDEYGGSCELQLARLEEYQLASEYVSEIRIQDSDGDFRFLAEIPRRSEQAGETTYIVTGYSKSVLLERAMRMTLEFPGGLASTAANLLANPWGITADWQAYDYYIHPNLFYVNDETPIEAIKRLTGAIGARVQATFDGNIRVVREYEHDTTRWEMVTPTYVLHDQRDFFTTGETIELRDNYNVFRITDQDIPEDNFFLREEVINSTSKFIRGYQVPFDTQEILQLRTSGGSGTTIEPLGTMIEELEPEVIEIVQGEGKTSLPIFEIVSINYLHDSLGSITSNEDGTLTTSVSGQSLVEVTYQTRYRLWKVTDNRIGQIQFWLQGEG